jgi:hypothetical protein
MNKPKFLTTVILLFAALAILGGADPCWAQTQKNNQQTMTNYERFQEERAAKRAAQGQMDSITPAQRKAAAQRLKATLDAQGQQSAPTSGGEVTK